MSPELLSKHASGARCVTVHRKAAAVIWKFDDGSEITTSDDLSTREGQMLVAQAAERLGLGNRQEIVNQLRGLGGSAVGDGPILHSDNRDLPLD